MALAITIAGSNLTSQYQTGTLRITERLQNKSNSAQLTIVKKSSGTAPAQGSSISITDGARKLFAGFITQSDPTEYGIGSLLVYNIEATDYTYLLNAREAQIAYEDATLKDIVEDLLGRYAPDQAFNTTAVATGPTLSTITFDHISLRACFEKLAKRTGYVWTIDYDKNVTFDLPTATAAPEDLRDASPSNHEAVTIEYDVSQVRNVVRVIGSSDGEASESPVIQEFTADGTTRSWELDDRPHSISSILVDGVSKQFSLDVNERDDDDLVYSFSGRTIKVATNGSVPSNGQTIEVYFYPRVPIIVERRDLDSIAFFAALEGGDGTHFYTVRDTSIASKSEARDRADQELAEFADPLVNGTFKTRSDMLGGSSIFAPGQYLTVNMPSWAISTDTAFLIQEVKISLAESNSGIIYQYEVRFGGKLVGVQEFLESLASPAEDTQESEEIKTIFGVQDSFVVEENAAPTEAEITGNFEYGAGGNPQGKWNLSEYA